MQGPDRRSVTVSLASRFPTTYSDHDAEPREAPEPPLKHRVAFRPARLLLLAVTPLRHLLLLLHWNPPPEHPNLDRGDCGVPARDASCPRSPPAHMSRYAVSRAHNVATPLG